MLFLAVFLKTHKKNIINPQKYQPKEHLCIYCFKDESKPNTKKTFFVWVFFKNKKRTFSWVYNGTVGVQDSLMYFIITVGAFSPSTVCELINTYTRGFITNSYSHIPYTGPPGFFAEEATGATEAALGLPRLGDTAKTHSAPSSGELAAAWA